MSILKLLAIFPLSGLAFGAMILPKEPPIPLLPKNDFTPKNHVYLPKLKPHHIDVASASDLAKAYVFKISTPFTLRKAQKIVSVFQKKGVPAYIKFNSKNRNTVIIGPELSLMSLKKLISQVHLTSKNGRIFIFNVYSLGATS